MNKSIKVNIEVTERDIDMALKVLVDNGIPEERASDVLQAIGYVLYREEDKYEESAV